MFGLPIHPILVHFPLVFASLLPLLALVALWLGSRSQRRPWWGIAFLHVFLLGLCFVAVKSGEKDEDKVKQVLSSEEPLETHAEKGEWLMRLTAGTLVLTVLGLFPGKMGLTGRLMGTLAYFMLLYQALMVGHTGGLLVYRHGAASAHVTKEKLPSGHRLGR